MSTPFQQLLIPGWVAASLILFLVGCLLGWILSVVAAFRSRRGWFYRLLVCFPLSNPFVITHLAWCERGRARDAVIIYAASFAILLIGGKIAHSLELARLEDTMEGLHERGEGLDPDSLKSELVSDDDNIWTHPFFIPLVTTSGQGEATDDFSKPNGYERLRDIPSDAWIMQTDSPLPGDRSNFNSLHEAAIAILADVSDDFAVKGSPSAWNEIGMIVVDYYGDTEPQLSELFEALNRHASRYPDEWSGGQSAMLGHLSLLKDISTTLSLRCAAYSAMGEAESSFTDARYGIRMALAPPSDLLLSRLVQFAQMHIALGAMQTAQHFHLWNQDQLALLDSELSRFFLPGFMADSIRAERIYGARFAGPIIQSPSAETLRSMVETPFEVRDDEPKFAQRLFDTVWENLFAHHLAAFWARQWIDCLDAYQGLIDRIENAVSTPETSAWSEIELNEEVIEGQGIMAAMMLPALETSFEKALSSQTYVHLGRVAIGLEQYRLRHGRYPETLEPLFAELSDLPEFDPMSAEPWIYEPIDNGRGFSIHSVGFNGEDDGGAFREDSTDDIAWIIAAKPPRVPEFTYEEPRFLKAYGINQGESE